jgi:hypothetical protein
VAEDQMKHLERHPEPVPGCFGCKVIGMNFIIPHYMSAKSDDNATREVYAETKRVAEAMGDAAVPANSRWI